MKKFIPIILISLVIAIAGGIYYFNAIFIPVKLKAIVNEKGQELLSRQVSFDQIQYNFGQGIRIKNFRLAQKDDPQKTLFSAQEISSKIPLIPLIKDKKIIMPQVTIKNFSGNIFRFHEGKWNFSDLFGPRPPSTEESFKVLLGKVVLQNGNINISDKYNAFGTFDLTIISTTASLSLPLKAHIVFDGGIPASKTTLKLDGDYFFADKSEKFKVTASNLDVLKRAVPFTNLKTPFEKMFINNIQGSVDYGTEQTKFHGDISGAVTADVDNIHLDGTIAVSGLDLAKGKDHLYSDIASMNMTDASVKINNNISYTGNLELQKAQVTKENNSFSLAGAFTLNPNSLVIGDASITAKSFSVDQFNLEQTYDEENKPKTTTIKFGLSAPSLQLDEKKNKISGDLSAPKINIKIEDGTISAVFPLSLKNASILQGDTLKATGDLDINTLATLKTKESITINGEASSDQISFVLPDKRAGEVSPQFSFRIIKDLTKLAELTYSVKTKLENGHLSNAFPPDFQELDNIRGNVDVINDNIYFKDLLVDTRKTTIGINGELRTFSKLISDLDLEVKNVDIQQWLPLAKQYIEPYGVEINGTTDASLRIQGPLIGPKKPEFSIEANLQTADISSTKYPYKFQNVNGLIKYKEDLLSWNDLRFDFNKEKYDSTGTLKDFQSPIVSVKLQGPGFFVSLNASSTADEYDISRADIKTKRSSLSGQGSIRLDDNNPSGKFHIAGNIVLSDLKQLHPFIRQKMDEFDILGEGAIDLSYEGPLKNPLDATFALVYQSPYTSVKNLKYNNVDMEINQPQPREESFSLTSDFYNGKITASGNLKVQDNFPLKAQARGFDIDIGELQKDLPIKKQDIGGTLAASMFLEGPVKKTQDITGQGRIEINQAHFAKPNFLKGILGLIINPKYQNTVFSDAKAKLFIRDNKLKIMDIFLKGESLDLTGYGWIDLDKNIDFTISPSFKNSLSIKPGLLKTGTEDLLEKYISIRVTGKIGAPKYSSNINPSNIVEDTADMISGGVQGIMKGLGL